MVSQNYFDLHFLTTKDVEQFLNCPSSICNSSVENSLFISVTHFLIGLFGHLMLCILEISPLFDVGLVKIFSHTVGCHFVLVTASFDLQKLSVSGGFIY